MRKLTNTQLMILSKAAAHDLGAAERPQRLNAAAALKLGASMVSRKLMREGPARRGMPIWRTDETGRSMSLTITKAGRAAIHIVDESSDDTSTEQPATTLHRSSPMGTTSRQAGKRRRLDAAPLAEIAQPENAAPQPRTVSKQNMVIAMLSDASGATLDALMASTGWLPHTTRAALSGLRKRGYAIEHKRDENAASRYRIVAAAAPGSGA